ncbi:hypothetical protein Syun_014282 [Stephania yunnanensis]|uniref:Uncharacterized protein n=1 Tax=Stephania yunnanensis TaxID=152371 RepID=A0AAP0JJ84_9MAGN
MASRNSSSSAAHGYVEAADEQRGTCKALDERRGTCKVADARQQRTAELTSD